MIRSVSLCLSLALLFAVASAINLDTCTQDSACDIAIGDSCDSATFKTAKCVTDAYCSNSIKKCAAVPSSAGADCSESNDCTGGFYCDTTTKKCVAELADGEACTTSTQCKNSCDSLTTKKCVSYKYSFVGEGDSCAKTPSGNTIKYPVCGSGTYCDAATQKCAKQANKGEDCTTKECNDGLNCGTGKVCVAYYSVAVGETCEDDYECIVGAKCDSNKCAAITSTEKGCNATTTCGDFFSDETCYCTKYGGMARCLVNDKHYIPTGDKCKSDIDALHSCLDSKKNCGTQDSAASCCLSYEFDVYTDAYRHDKGSIGGKDYAELCDGVGCSSTSGSAVVVVSQLAVVAAALFALMF